MKNKMADFKVDLNIDNIGPHTNMAFQDDINSIKQETEFNSFIQSRNWR